MQHVHDFQLSLAIVGRVRRSHLAVKGKLDHFLTNGDAKLVQLCLEVWDLCTAPSLITLILRSLLLLHDILHDFGEEERKHVERHLTAWLEISLECLVRPTALITHHFILN